MENTTISYDNEALVEFEALLKAEKFSKVFFLVDENTHENCLIPLLQHVAIIPENEILEVEAGEGSKSPEVLSQLWMAMSELEADRKALLVNIGGGMITDLGGFLAATYMRGVAFVNFPTSVLAQVDASVGGKTGINLNQLKNRVGVFQQPMCTFIVNDFLDTLSLDERKSGFAEMLKHGLIADEAYWNELIQFDIHKNVPPTAMIRRSVEIKSKIVEADFREEGARKSLNFGHTVGHALETAAMHYERHLPHGYAIAFGMMAELLLSGKACSLDEKVMVEAVQHIHNIYGSTELYGDPEEWMEFMKADKKNFKGEFNFALISAIGSPKIDVQASTDEVLGILKYIKSL